MSFDSHRDPQMFDPEPEELSDEEEEMIQKCADAILKADPAFSKWLDALRKESEAAMDADEERKVN